LDRVLSMGKIPTGRAIRGGDATSSTREWSQIFAGLAETGKTGEEKDDRVGRQTQGLDYYHQAIRERSLRR